MVKEKLTDLLKQNDKIDNWLNQLTTGRQLLMGLSSSSKALAIATAFNIKKGKFVIVTSNQTEAENLLSDLSCLIDESYLYQFFVDDIPAVEFLFSSLDRTLSRLETLNFLCDEMKPGILVTSVIGTKILLPKPIHYQKNMLQLSIGDDKDIDDIVKHLSNNGYERTSQVLNPGEFSKRGDILDIFEITESNPFRIEFFGDEIDGIRIFNSETQKSIRNLENLTISPATDIIITPSDFDRAIDKLEKTINNSDNEELINYFTEFLEVTKEGNRHTDIRRFLSFFYDNSYCLLDYFSEDTIVFLDDFQKIMDRSSRFDLDVAHLLTEDLQKSKAVSNQVYFADSYKQLRQYQPSTFFSSFHRGLGHIKFNAIHQFTQYPIQEFFNQFPLLVDEINRYQKQKTTVLIQADSEKSLLNLQKILEDYHLELPITDKKNLLKNKAQLFVNQLSTGFHLTDEKIVLITEREIFHKKIKRRSRHSNISNAERLKDYSELQKGDYVVHQVHGIGKYLGIDTIEINGKHRDYLTIQYQNSDTVSIPIEHVNSLSKYVSADGKAPKINKLNDGRFQKTKRKVSKQVEDIADDLLKLYAERNELKGFAFSPDDDSQREFDEDFAYIETEDQLRSISEVKKDMESDKPMDRLLVGDVGFGKTEVAMRAAFKAVNDNKQVVILVPTTVLAHQHYINFKERFDNQPINIEELSRFKSKKEQNVILDKLKKGQIDIIIGTHRLLSKDVKFFDLGLIVVDEEQRFGVKHKETLKELKAKVDVLTLTATPIPRTLHMSMLGIRDLSIIETPPTNRYPVQTYVTPMNPDLIREGILREINRNGQVFYVYNKVDTIEQKVSDLQSLVPEASICFVHGQMSEVQLEDTLLDFIEGVYDVLVATTIIETGIDISNVNTLFIENADHMGLSTLYQLRGRVGRSNRIAYAYLMYRPDKILSEISEKRLDAIKGFTELGSGFKIAMRDLSIRGAGNLLGASQSGFIDSVGFEMYSQLLQDAILKKQGKSQVRQKGNAELNLHIDAYIPTDYISDERQKIEIYKRIREIKSHADYEELQNDIIDRFGDYPDSVAYLLEIGLIKAYLDQVFVEYVEQNDDQLKIRFEKITQNLFLTQDYFEAISKTTLKARIGEYQGQIEIIFNIKNKKDTSILVELIKFSQSFLEIKLRKTKKE